MVSERHDYELFLNSLTSALILINAKFQISYVNEAALSLLETGIKQVKERPLGDFLVGNSLNQDQILRALQHGEEFRETSVQLCFRDGRCTTVDLNTNVLTIDDVRHALLEIIPIDKQRKISRESQQHAQQVAARDLVRGLAHEIKNPLGGIRGAAQLLEKQLVNADQVEFTQMIIEQSDRLRNLVDRLLGPNSLPRKSMINIHESLDKVITVIQNDLSFSLLFVRDYDPSIPDIYADPDMLQQTILNIARNASQALKSYCKKHSEHKPIITFKTRIERQCVIKGVRHALSAKINIIDNGAGVPTALKDTLFYPMVTSKKQGSGLGLSIAQTLTDHHQGKIDVESYPGYTNFTIYIPIFSDDNLTNLKQDEHK